MTGAEEILHPGILALGTNKNPVLWLHFDSRLLYHGPYEGLGGAWHEFGKWPQENGYETAGDLYECYLVGPDSTANPTDWRTELSRTMVIG